MEKVRLKMNRTSSSEKGVNVLGTKHRAVEKKILMNDQNSR
jgi:hypothetical protein